MTHVLLIDDDPGIQTTYGVILRGAGYRVLVASSGRDGLACLDDLPTCAAIIVDLRLPDMSGLDVLRSGRKRRPLTPFIVVTAHASTREAVLAMKLGADDFVEKPLGPSRLIDLLRQARNEQPLERDPQAASNKPHAAERWARALLPLMDSASDPRGIAAWSRTIAASPGAIRNWCRTVGIPPRRSLVFARLLRAVHFGHGGTKKPENLLDIVDRRTLVNLLKCAGLTTEDLATDVETFLSRQSLVVDPDVLATVRTIIHDNSRRQSRHLQ
jgi:FixJ family two-component response regulator